MSYPLKLAEDSEDHEIFDINDFTTASDWERFVVHLEELITTWKINGNNNNNSSGGDSNTTSVDQLDYQVKRRVYGHLTY